MAHCEHIPAIVPIFSNPLGLGQPVGWPDLGSYEVGRYVRVAAGLIQSTESGVHEHHLVGTREVNNPIDI